MVNTSKYPEEELWFNTDRRTLSKKNIDQSFVIWSSSTHQSSASVLHLNTHENCPLQTITDAQSLIFSFQSIFLDLSVNLDCFSCSIIKCNKYIYKNSTTINKLFGIKFKKLITANKNYPFLCECVWRSLKYHFEKHLTHDISNFSVIGIPPQKLPIT